MLLHDLQCFHKGMLTIQGKTGSGTSVVLSIPGKP